MPGPEFAELREAADSQEEPCRRARTVFGGCGVGWLLVSGSGSARLWADAQR